MTGEVHEAHLFVGALGASTGWEAGALVAPPVAPAPSPIRSNRLGAGSRIWPKSGCPRSKKTVYSTSVAIGLPPSIAGHLPMLTRHYVLLGLIGHYVVS